MVRFGYALSSEEHRPSDLVRNAALAEEAGFEFALISDHFHPWIDAQGHSPFVWTVLGAIARETERLQVGTGVTCPMIRTHPAIIAHAAATTADMFEGRFFLGIGTGENLNEHVLGDHWPAYDERREMLIESMDVMRGLWEGGLYSHRGEHYVVENARLYTLPANPIRIVVAAGGPETAKVAGQQGDGLIITSADAAVLEAYRRAGGNEKPIYGQVTGCWAASKDAATDTMHRIWPTGALHGDLTQELPLPQHFEDATRLVTPEMLAEASPLGPETDRWVESVRELVDAGVKNVYLHQVGPDQAGFFRFFREELRPAMSRMTERQPAGAAS